MKRIDINSIGDFKNNLAQLKEGEPLFLVSGKEEKYVVIDIVSFDAMQRSLASDIQKNPLKYFDPSKLEIRVMSDPNRPELTEEEYESIKKQLNDALEKSLKPKHKYKLSQS